MRFLILALLLMSTFAYAQTQAQKQQARQVLEEEFAKYPRPHSNVTTGKILNDAALRAPGWVLLGKKGGNRCPLPDGRDISCDFFVFKSTVRGWDVIGSVGAPNSNVSGPNSSAGEDMRPAIADGSRTLEEPVGSVPPPVDPPPVDPPFDPTPLIQRIDELQARVDALSGQLAVAFEQLAELSSVVAGADAKAEGVRNYLKSRPIPDGCRVPLLGCRLTFNAPPIE